MTLEKGSRYELSGNTFANKEVIRSLGAQWDKNAKVWSLDLCDCSKTHIQRDLSHKAFQLSRSGVNFKRIN